jgi:hypothetical protein
MTKQELVARYEEKLKAAVINANTNAGLYPDRSRHCERKYWHIQDKCEVEFTEEVLNDLRELDEPKREKSKEYIEGYVDGIKKGVSVIDKIVAELED